MVSVQEECRSRETWSLECRCCEGVWQEAYDVRRLTDGHGHEAVVWEQGGEPVQPPWSGVECARCGSSRLSAFPQGEAWLGRAALRAAPAGEEADRPPVERLYSPVPHRSTAPALLSSGLY
ncbi:hypothetical protein ACFOWE_01675 [Planomonospora corallina]|uniref:Uncharacterized protein n=1 Tax=Planomonospora corallina TaxID=1806052 RepID=A0ABV8I4V8_9ACTN